MDDVSVSNSELLETTDSEDDTTDVSDDKLHKEGESESLSDIDDAEVGSYLYDEKEKHYRKQIWEMMNKKYLQEQAERVAAAANGTKFKRELRNKRTTGVKKSQSTSKTTSPTSPKKRPNSRINYDALSKVLDEPLPSDSSKKRRSEPTLDKHVGESSIGTQVNDDAGNETEDEENGREDHSNYSEYNNQEDEYDYYDDNDDGFF
ncbi:transcription factor IIIB 90 kDa subunit [Chenopodium quinoa]|uniref:transcription factor IIIB 90 kDa subunit n=1 Tax=Chenopodium quinoa TaxID=63459 RepID=UPI000B76FBF3|nr:transcription factor IIIB 90 kDa subunit [Chenopodium quinoa]XP_021764055.1 transcription factor IIIB 90 kDa subunit [Chenopodium quinoa]